MEHIITVIISIITASTTALVTYFSTAKSNDAKVRQEILQEQKYKYFLPFKYHSEEFFHRLLQIEMAITEKDDTILSQFSNNFQNEDLESYFIDSNDGGISSSRKYLKASTIYINCVLYYKMKIMQSEYPFMNVEIRQSIEKHIKENHDYEQLKRCIEEVVTGKRPLQKNIVNNYIKHQGKLNLNKIVKNIRLSTVLREGIPYTLIYSFGDFITSGKEIINYEQFCKHLSNPNERIKFIPLINFWNFNNEGTEILEKKLNAIRSLIVTLKLVELSDLK